MVAAEHLIAIRNKLGECPLWHHQHQALYWVDVEGEKFHRYFIDTDTLETFQVGQPIGCLAFRVNGGLVLGLRDGIAYWDWDSKSLEIIADPEPERTGARLNDGRVDSRGRFWAGTIGQDNQSKLYRLDPDGSLKIMETGISISNGIDWSPDDQTMYYTDTSLRIIYAYDFDPESGEIENRRDFIRVPVSDGFPDGLTVDSEGFIWSAQWDGWQVVRYDPDGKMERAVPLPVQRPTSCAFGGPGLDHLFITSAWTGLSESDKQEQLFAGDLFLLYSGIKGKAEHVFLV